MLKVSLMWYHCRAVGMTCNDRRSLPNPAGDLGKLPVLQRVQSRALVGCLGVKLPEAQIILRFAECRKTTLIPY